MPVNQSVKQSIGERVRHPTEFPGAQIYARTLRGAESRASSTSGRKSKSGKDPNPGDPTRPDPLRARAQRDPGPVGGTRSAREQTE